MRLARLLPPAAALLLAFDVNASERQVSVDANIVTGLDTSDSIGRHEEWIEREGLARAVVHSSFLDAIKAGVRGRIGFSAYTWSSNGNSEVLVPWTVITSPGDAAAVAGRLRSARLIDERRFDDGARDQAEADEPIDERLTDTAEAIRLGAKHLRNAPFRSTRLVMNIVGNGSSNAGEEPWKARQEALDRGLVINGLIVGRDLPAVVEHFRSGVIGGPGSFLLQLADPGVLTEAFVAKLRMDIATTLPRESSPTSLSSAY